MSSHRSKITIVSFAMTMADSSNIDGPLGLLPGGAVQGFRFLGGDNDNNNNNQNNNNNNQNNNNNNNNKDNNQNNNNNNQNNNYSNYSNTVVLYANAKASLFTGTIAFCSVAILLVIFRIKCHRRSERKRKRLGISRSNIHRKKKISVTNTFEEEDDNGLVTDEEIRRFILPSKTEKSMVEAANVVRCDRETDRIMKLCRPFWLQAIVSGICDVLNTALLGRALGVNALAIYYIVNVPTSFTDTIISTVLDTVSSLGGQSIGVGSYKLTGQYCQISIILVRIFCLNTLRIAIQCVVLSAKDLLSTEMGIVELLSVSNHFARLYVCSFLSSCN